MELEQFKADLLNVINHYGKTVNIGTVYYVVKDVFRDVAEAYEGWIEQQTQRNAEAAAEGDAPDKQVEETVSAE